MYIQITTRCQMHCAHCCFSCEKHGIDLSWTSFSAAIDLVVEMTCPVTLGGGEPTLHPLFWKMLEEASRRLPKGYVAVITNGHDRRQAMRLLSWHQAEKVDASLSVDQFHSPIEQDVIDAYTTLGLTKGHLEPDEISNTGRAAENDIGFPSHDGSPSCPCSGPFLYPDGNLYPCGCLEHSFGTDPKFWKDSFSSYLQKSIYPCTSLERWKLQRLKQMQEFGMRP